MSRHRVVGFVLVLLLIPLLGQTGPCGVVDPTPGDPIPGQVGPQGPPGLDCWDLNGNNNCDDDEDTNDDGVCDALDCQGAEGPQGPAGLVIDDPNEVAEALKADSDFLEKVEGPKGPPGPQGEPGLVIDDPDEVADALKSDPDFREAVQGDPGVSGLACWDLDGDGACDPAEDANSDDKCDALDCQGSDGGGAGDITAVTAGSGLTGGGSSGAVALSIDTSGASSGQAIMYDGSSVVWDTFGSGPPSGPAGGDLAGNYPNPEIASGAVTSTHLANNSVTSSKIANDAVTLNKISASGAANGKALKCNGTGMYWGTDETGNGSSDHGQLTGLGDDDHPQYMPVTRSGDEYNVGQKKLVFRAMSNNPTIQIDLPTGGSPATIRYRDNKDLVIDGRNFVTLSANGSVDVYDYNDSRWGEINAAKFNVMSSRRLKRDIQELDRAQCGDWLDMIASLQPANYLLEWDTLPEDGVARFTDREVPRLGLIAEDLPRQLQATIHRDDRVGVDLYALTTALVVAVKELDAKVDEQTEVITELRAELEELDRLVGNHEK